MLTKVRKKVANTQNNDKTSFHFARSKYFYVYFLFGVATQKDAAKMTFFPTFVSVCTFYGRFLFVQTHFIVCTI